MSYLKYLFFILKEYFFKKKKEKLIKNLLLASFPDCIHVGRWGWRGRDRLCPGRTAGWGSARPGAGGWEEGVLPPGKGAGMGEGGVGRTLAQAGQGGWGSRSWGATRRSCSESRRTLGPEPGLLLGSSGPEQLSHRRHCCPCSCLTPGDTLSLQPSSQPPGTPSLGNKRVWNRMVTDAGTLKQPPVSPWCFAGVQGSPS